MIFVGKRKESKARLNVKNGSGRIFINSKSIESYFRNKYLELFVKEPLLLSNGIGEKYDFYVNVEGGGLISQAQAVRQAIGRCLVHHHKELEKIFLEYDRNLLVFDSRRNEPHHSSGKGASKRGSRRHKQRSKR
ncbi:MAG: 30S ribosomal protein S9 [Candidatus Aenigmarchaeota archaeon]|nr:30S ribosomal protein S9 [Candidatus Aenigmarchaeota archaeon]MDW8149306.1 30S ribosomal protein S9 [Candidatus Aenigmarchaeota archaeon]